LAGQELAIRVCDQEGRIGRAEVEAEVGFEAELVEGGLELEIEWEDVPKAAAG